MTPSYELTEGNVTGQMSGIRAQFDRLMAGLTAAQINWQPDNGRRWSIGQCLDHITKSADIYCAAISAAVDEAPPSRGSSARPNVLGRAFIWFIEPPVRFRTAAPGTAHPTSDFDLASVRSDFVRGLGNVHDLALRSLKVDSGKTRFANPFASGRRVFNVCTGVMVLLAHARRHLLQAEQVRARSHFPSA